MSTSPVSEITSLVRPLDLNRNELYLPWPDEVLAAARCGLLDARGYPSWNAAALREALAHRYRTSPEHVVTGAGSIAVIAQAMLVAGPGELVLPWPGFEALPPLAAARGLRVRHTALRGTDGAVDLDMVRAALGPTTCMVLLCAPNSPTGGGLTHSELTEFLRDVPEHVLVLVDQAYGEFIDHPDPPRPTELTTAHPRLMVTRTFSKAYGLAGLRVGYGLAQPALAAELDRAGLPYAVTLAAEHAALEALRIPDTLRTTVARVRAERTRLAQGLRERGESVTVGHGNFVWLPTREQTSQALHRLASLGIRVKGYPRHGLRITVGSTQDTDQLLRRWPTTLAD